MNARLALRRSPVVGLLVTATAFSGCAAHGPPPGGPPPTAVSTAKVARGDISTYVTFDGQITPIYQTTLSTAEAGTIAEVNVTEGDFVHRGQVLATLDTSQLQASLKANEATVRQDAALLQHSAVAAPVASQQYSSAVSTARQNLQSAINTVSTARAALEHDDLTQTADRDLLRQQYVSRQTYEAARATYTSSRETLRTDLQAVPAAEASLRTALSNTDQRREDQATIAQNAAGLDAARANVELLQAQIAQASIVAPFDGQVTQRLLDPGGYAGASSGIFEIAQVSRVYVIANVPDVDLPFVERGKAVTFTSASLPGRTFKGTVFDVNTTPTSGTLSYRVRLLQANPGLLLRGGMLVNVTTRSAHHKHVLLLPSAALVTGTDGDSVLTVVKGKAKNIPVKTGLTTDTQVEVTARPLKAGATVITSPPSGVRDGSPVAGPGSGPPPGAPPGGGPPPGGGK